MSNRIAKYRKEVRMTQAEFGSLLGWSQSRLANYENGIREPKLDECRAIAQKFQSLGLENATLENVFPPQSTESAA